MTLYQGSLARPAQPQLPSISEERAEQKATSTLQHKASQQVAGVKGHEPKGAASPRAELRAVGWCRVTLRGVVGSTKGRLPGSKNAGTGQA